MNTREAKWLNLRGFVILTASVAGLGLPITGLANHFHQMDPMVSFSRHAWMSAHTVLGVLFTVAVAWHAFLNRSMLLNRARGHAAGSGISREAAGAIIFVTVTLLLAVGHAFH